MKIELRPLAEITPYEKNRRLNDAAVDAVAESIRRFGFLCGVRLVGDDKPRPASPPAPPRVRSAFVRPDGRPWIDVDRFRETFTRLGS